MASLDEVKAIVAQVLQIGSRFESYTADSALLGSVPEFDSMAVVSIVIALEEALDIEVDDDEISAEIFETLGSLQDFINFKLGQLS